MTRYRTFFFYILPGIFFLLLALLLFLKPEMSFPGTSERLAGQKNHIEKTIAAITKVSTENRKLASELELMTQIRRGALKRESNGAMILRERLDNAAAKSQIAIRAVGEIQKREVVPDELDIYEVSFSAECTLKELTALAEDFFEGLPRIYWKNLAIKPNFNRQESLLILSGTVSMIAVEERDE